MKDTFKRFVFVLIGAFFLMLDAFINGFPIVYSDTSTYIASGLELEMPFDRPITYGLFLRFFSFNGFSLWFVVFFQALILSYLIFLVVSLVTDEKSYLNSGLATIIFLSLFSGLSWTVSQLMPDIFTSIALLCMILILTGKFRRGILILLFVLFFISVAMHMSHILLFSLILIALFIFRKLFLPEQAYPIRNTRIITLLFFTLVSIFTMGSALSKSKHVFFMGAMVEHGIVKKYLDDYCETRHYKLCAYKDSLPDRAYFFVWDKTSPFYKIGGWKETKTEFNEIIYGTLTQPKYIGIHIQESVKATLKQISLFAIGDGNGKFLEGTVLYTRISNYFPHDLPAYSASKQNQSKLGFLNFFNPLFSIVLVLCLPLLIYLFTKFSSKINGHLKLIIFVVFIGIFLNAWDCGTFANAIDRLGCKMAWLIPFLTLILSFRYLRYPVTFYNKKTT